MRLKYKSEICKMLHEDSVADFGAGAITEEQMREFDRDCLVQDEPATPKARKPSPVRAKRAALAD